MGYTWQLKRKHASRDTEWQEQFPKTIWHKCHHLETNNASLGQSMGVSRSINPHVRTGVHTLTSSIQAVEFMQVAMQRGRKVERNQRAHECSYTLVTYLPSSQDRSACRTKESSDFWIRSHRTIHF